MSFWETVSKQNKVKGEPKTMKRFLKKKWGKLPIGILAVVMALVLATTGAVFAAYTVFTNTVQVGVEEVLEVTEIQAPGLDDPVYAGGEIGISEANGGKYFIQNLGSQPITVTIAVDELSLQMAWYGLKGFCATTGFETPGHDAEVYNWDDPICNTVGPNTQVQTCTFELGTVDYDYAALIAQGMTRDEIRASIGRDSSCVKFFVDGVVLDDADPEKSLGFTVTVTRG